jgi:hypothetical protein
MLAHVVWHTILALIAGIAIAALFWNLSSKRRKALRAIDLASYFLTLPLSVPVFMGCGIKRTDTKRPWSACFSPTSMLIRVGTTA